MPHEDGGVHCAARQARNEWPFSLCRCAAGPPPAPPCYPLPMPRTSCDAQHARTPRVGRALAARGTRTAHAAGWRSACAAGSLAWLVACGAFTGSAGAGDGGASGSSSSSGAGPTQDAAKDSASDAALPAQDAGGAPDAAPKTFSCGDAATCSLCCATDKAAQCLREAEDCSKSTISCVSAAQCEPGQKCVAKITGPGDVQSTSCVPADAVGPAGEFPVCLLSTDCSAGQCTAANCPGITLSVCVGGTASPKCKK